MPQDDALGSTWRALCSLLSTQEREPGRYALRLLDPRPTQDGVILNEVYFTVEPKESGKPTSGSLPSDLTPDSLVTCVDGVRTVNYTQLNSIIDQFRRDLRRLSDERAKTQPWTGSPLIPSATRQPRG
jgi:hypothetical protein